MAAPQLRSVADYALALVATAVVTSFTYGFREQLGLAASALLFLLPVLVTSARGGIWPSLAAAGASMLAYNFFLLPPHFTLRVHGYDNIVSVVVLFTVAIVTSRLANSLKARERAAMASALGSAEAAAFTEALASKTELSELDVTATEFLGARYGRTLLVVETMAPIPAMTSLDRGASVWAAHNGDTTGHGTSVMPAADWSFLPLHTGVPLDAGRHGDLLAVARPIGGQIRSAEEIIQLRSLAGLLGRARDRLALEAERQVRGRLEELDDMRRTLLASLAHDFRTPLTVIRGGVEALRDRTADAHDVELLLHELHRLERTLADLLGLARIEADRVGVSREPLDLVDIVGDVVERGHVVPGDVTLDIAVGSDLPLVDADPVLLRQMLLNLVDNAIRYGDGRIEIAATLEDGHVLLTVGDNGDGIEADQEEAIFERFTKIAVGDRTGGSGLGLAIVAGFARAMGVQATAANGTEGAIFSLRLPVYRGDAVK